jgi:hypothetical protein
MLPRTQPNPQPFGRLACFFIKVVSGRPSFVPHIVFAPISILNSDITSLHKHYEVMAVFDPQLFFRINYIQYLDRLLYEPKRVDVLDIVQLGVSEVLEYLYRG